jgi:hypothetical protein
MLTVALIRNPVNAVVSGRGLELQIAKVEERPEPPMHVSFARGVRLGSTSTGTLNRVQITSS